MLRIADRARPRRRRRAARSYTNSLGDWLSIAVTIALFVGLLWWMTAVATS